MTNIPKLHQFMRPLLELLEEKGAPSHNAVNEAEVKKATLPGGQIAASYKKSLITLNSCSTLTNVISKTLDQEKHTHHSSEESGGWSCFSFGVPTQEFLES